jgi:hypothetical protein
MGKETSKKNKHLSTPLLEKIGDQLEKEETQKQETSILFFNSINKETGQIEVEKKEIRWNNLKN